MRNLYFIDSSNNKRLIASNVDFNAACEYIHAFLEEHDFRMYYMRTWKTNSGTKIDVGSHTEFFLWGE